MVKAVWRHESALAHQRFISGRCSPRGRTQRKRERQEEKERRRQRKRRYGWLELEEEGGTEWLEAGKRD